MRLRLNSIFLVLTAHFATAWNIGPSSPRRIATRFSAVRKLYMTRNNKDLHSFDYLLQEGESGSISLDSSSSSVVQSHSRRHNIIVPGGDERKAILASSISFPSAEAEAAAQQQEQLGSNSYEQGTETTATETGDGTSAYEYDPYGDMDSQMSKINQYQEQQQEVNTINSRLQKMDFQDLVITIFIPCVIAFAGGRWVFNRASERVQGKTEVSLDSFANEMVYHDGDFEEMKMCYNDYNRRLMWMGPLKTESMIKRYLRAYAKKKTVSPQAISSLSYVFTLFKLSEAKAAQILVSLCKEMGSDKISSAGKLLFFGSRILKSEEGKAALLPIKDMIKGTYRDEAVAETLVDTSQQAIGEAAYRTAVLEAGKKQKSLTIGWEVLGLKRETATRIFEDVAEEGFLTDREAMYGGQSQKYDKKGRRLDSEGKLENPEEADDGDDDDADTEQEASNVYSCDSCGYTLFIAQGREFKFYGDDFECPECGAAKDKFTPGLESDD